MPETKYEEKGYELENGMKIHLDRPGISGQTNMGEHLDLVIEGRNGSKARIKVTCSGDASGQYVELEALFGGPLKLARQTFSPSSASFVPNNLVKVVVRQDCSIETVLGGRPHTFQLRLLGSER